ncbi:MULTISPECIES: hypothetical protein [unclassified Streptomyces]|uniref:hypothetical protein n=1 Tax=unclassified Streptomyces TaxID=2593676 RepID=UPI00382200A4
MNDFSRLSIGPGHGWPHFPEPHPVEPGRWPELEAALAVVNRDLSATLPDQDPLILMFSPSSEPTPRSPVDHGQVYVAMADGRWHGNSVHSYDPEESDPPEQDDATTVLTVVAEAAQETVMELLWQVWPLCSAHKIGMHPRPAGTANGWYPSEADPAGPPVWWCRGGRDGSYHDVCLVGELADTLPGKQRRALRRSERRKDGRD